MKLENTLKGIHNRLDDVEQRIYKVEDRVGKNNEVELKRKEKIVVSLVSWITWFVFVV